MVKDVSKSFELTSAKRLNYHSQLKMFLASPGVILLYSCQAVGNKTENCMLPHQSTSVWSLSIHTDLGKSLQIWAHLLSCSLVVESVPNGVPCLFSPGMRHAGVHRPRGHPEAGLRQARGLVGHGGHPVRVPGGLRSVLRGHAGGAVWTGHQW